MAIVTLLFKLCSPKAETFEILLPFYLSLKAIGETLLEILWKQGKFVYITTLWPCYLGHGHQKLIFCNPAQGHHIAKTQSH